MRSLAVAVLLASAGYCHAASSKGCGQKLPDGITTDKSNNLTIKTSDGLERSYLLHLPSNYDPKKPHGLIWSYHGRGKNATHQEDITGLSKSASNPDHIVVYPQGMTPVSSKSSKLRMRRDSDDDDDDDDDEEDEDEDDSEKGQASWQGDPDSTTNDVKFTLELLEDISKSYCVEEDKVYASGMSNGGGFVANILACDESATKKFAAFAAASGAYYQIDARGKCKPDSVAIQCDNKGAKVAIITTAGGKDNTIPFMGGSQALSPVRPALPRHLGRAQWPSINKRDVDGRQHQCGTLLLRPGRRCRYGAVILHPRDGSPVAEWKREVTHQRDEGLYGLLRGLEYDETELCWQIASCVYVQCYGGGDGCGGATECVELPRIGTPDGVAWVDGLVLSAAFDDNEGST
jgi:poly(3-hydroxybutyrate) depolymerase